MTRLFKIMVYISDTHIGKEIVSSKELKRQLKKNFIDPLWSMRFLDVIFVAGDVADRALSLNNKYGQLYLWFGEELLEIGKEKGCSIIVIKGTQSHDMDQLESWDKFVHNKMGVDFRIFDNFQSTYLFDEGFKVLILPDKKVNKAEAKNIDDLLENQYDLIVGHGMIDSMRMFQQESENMSANSYIFPVDKLMSQCRGPVVFGHIHPHTNIRDKFYYISSFTKLERNEGEHGFLVCGIMTDYPSQYKMEFIKNPDSAKSHHILISRDELEEIEIEDIFMAIDSVIEEMKTTDLLQIKIKMDDKKSIIDKVLMIEERYRFSEYDISIVKKVKSKQNEETEKKNREDKIKYSYIMDENLSMEDIIVRFFNEEVRNTDPMFSSIEFTEYAIKEALSLLS